MEQTKKMPLIFLAGAIDAAKKEMSDRFSNTCAVSASGQYTVFQNDEDFFVAQGNLHDKVEAPFCIEFDLRFNHGAVVIQSQRIYQS